MVGGPSTLDIVFLCFTEKWWDWERDGFGGRTAVLAKGLERHPAVRRLLVVNTPTFMGRRKPSGLSAREPIARGSNCRVAGAGVFVLDQTRVLPGDRHYPASYAANAWLHDGALGSSISKTAAYLGLRRPVVWLSGPIVAKYAAAASPSAVVYDAVDEWLEHPAWSRMRKPIQRGYRQIREEADLVFAVTPTLARTFEGARPRVAVLPNGVDPEAFRTQALRRVPEALAKIPRPRVGYVGAIQQRLDVALIAELASRMPHEHFVLVGPVLDSSHVAPLAGIGNVHLLGKCRPEEVAGYLEGFDVCILPHVDSALTRNMDPVKLYEYVASRRPVVASDLPGLDHPRDVVWRASNATEWEARISDGIAGRDRPSSMTLDSYAERNSWAARIDTALELMSEVALGTGAGVGEGAWPDRASEYAVAASGTGGRT